MGTAHIHLGSVGSTNAEAMVRVAAGERGPIWIIADEQTAGRGRAGRGWVSPPGNFYGSLIQPLTCKPAIAHQLSLLAGLAVHDAILVACGRPVPGLVLKWPNDLLVGDAKLVGILIESTSTADGLVAVIGIGVNLMQLPDGVSRSVATLAPHGPPIAPLELLTPLSDAVQARLDVWRNGAGFGAIREAWLTRASPLGTGMSVNTGAGPVAGRFAGLDDDGGVVLELPGGTRRTFTFGDVMVGVSA